MCGRQAVIFVLLVCKAEPRINEVVLKEIAHSIIRRLIILMPHPRQPDSFRHWRVAWA